MKKGLHPEYFPDAEISCACGNVVKLGSTKKKMKVEVCSVCHPFYTGSLKSTVDAGGRVRRFKERYGIK
ncbi:MAG: 50S ribosomal protein L31 [candidate division WOR-3 bacterium]